MPDEPTLIDAEILILRWLRIGPFVAYDEEWPTLDRLVGLRLLNVKSGPEIQGRWYEITQAGHAAVDTAMTSKQETANAR